MEAGGVAGFVRRLADQAEYDRATDRELLGRFATQRDEWAFEAIVGRYARLVRSAAARVLTDPGDIDDATQATFLVLVRRAAREDWRAGLGPWLCGVAHRVAVKLVARGRRRPGPLGDADPSDRRGPPDPAWREMCDLLHAELDRLPDRYRLPLMLCYLEGQTRDEAAASLGVTAGTVKGRVRRGCELLRGRLARRGVSLSAGLLAAVAAPRPASGGSPASISAAALRGVPPGRVAELVREVTLAMSYVKRKAVAVGLAVAGGLFAAVASTVGQPGPVPQPVPPPAAPSSRERPPAEFLVMHPPGMVVLGPDGMEKERLKDTINGVRSPSGGWIAGVEYDNNPPTAADRGWLVIRPLGRPGEPHRVPLVFGQPGRSGGLPVGSADAGRVLIGENGFEDGGARGYAYRVYDLATKAVTAVKLPPGCNVTGWSADGKKFLADIGPPDGAVRVAWLNADGTGEPEYVSPDGELGYGGRLSPNGRRVLYLGGRVSPNGDGAKMRLYAHDLADGKRTAVDEPGETHGYCWSPDGTRVAYTWQRSLEKPAEVAERETRLVTCDPDGRNRKVVMSRKYVVPENSSGRDGIVLFFQLVDWR